MTFAELDAHPALLATLDLRGYTEPTPAQTAVLDPALAARDLLVSARTGSGKTVAFGLALARSLLGQAEAFPPPIARSPLGLVIAPTRELALQVEQELGWLFAETGAKVTSCVGGMDPRREARLLARGAHLVVGTPGRLRDHLERKNLALGSLGVLVLDEADEMLDLGFREELEAILGSAPEERRTLLFSATLPKPILELARRYTREAARVAATPPGEAHADISYRAHLVSPREREHAVVNVLRRLEPASALVFRAQRETVHHTAAGLCERGFEAVALSGELTQPERARALKALRDGRARVLVATDVAARGLDLPGVELVLHADLPRDASALQHRSGRTGRAGRKGLAVLLAAPSERLRLGRLLSEAGLTAAWSPVPQADEIRARDEERLAASVEALAGLATEEELAVARRLLEERAPLLVAAALVRRERARLPSPEELPDTLRAAREVPAAFTPRDEKARRPARGKPVPGQAIWFRVNLGREKSADPRWLLPLLCRRGGVDRDAIGKITVLAGETRFEVAAELADAFARAAAKPDPRMKAVRIGKVPAGKG